LVPVSWGIPPGLRAGAFGKGGKGKRKPQVVSLGFKAVNKVKPLFLTAKESL